MDLQTKIESILPTTLSRWAVTLWLPLTSAPFLLPDFLFAWMPPTQATVTWLGKLMLALLVSLLFLIVALCSVLYECYHKSNDLKGALEAARKRVKNP